MGSKAADHYNQKRKEEADHVYRCLVGVFPQLDKRSLSYLKAVAWEHSKDSNKAVEVVLQDGFLARISSRSGAAGPPPLVDSSPSSLPDGEAEHEEPVSTLRQRRVPSEETALSSRSVVKEDAIRTDITSAIHCGESAAREEGLTVLSCDASVETNQLEGNGETEHEENTDASASNEVILNAVIVEENNNNIANNEVIPNAVIHEQENTDNTAKNESSQTSFADPPPLVDSSPSSLPDGEAKHEEPVRMLPRMGVRMLRRRWVPSEETALSSRSVVKELTVLEEGLTVLSCDASVETNQLEGNGETEHEENTDDSASNEVIPNAVILEENNDNIANNEVIPNVVIHEQENTDNTAKNESSQTSFADPPPLVDSSPSSLPDGEAKHEEPVSMLRMRVRMLRGRWVPSEETALSSRSVVKELTVLEEGLTVLSCDASVETNQLEGNGETEHEENTDASASNEVIPNAVIVEENIDNIANNEVIPNAVIHEQENTDNTAKNESSQTSFVVECLDVGDRVSYDQEISEGVPSCLIQENDGLNLSFSSYHSDWMDFDGPELDDFDLVTAENNPVVESSLDHSEFPSSSGNENALYDRMEALEEKKRMLIQAMELDTKMTKDLELEKIAVEQAKEELLRLDIDILAKKQEFEQMIAHANEGYDMVAGEAYGERAILATEAGELDARILSLSDEHDKALALFDERRKTLGQQLAAENELRKALEREKWEKEESNQRDHAEREKEIEKVAERQKNIQQCIDNNTKQRELILDRGRIIDSWQGELSLILKEKFSLSGSISSSQTTCILASSDSSNVTSELGETLESPKQSCSPTCSVDGESPKSRQSDERVMPNNGKELLLEDGWDMLDA